MNTDRTQLYYVFDVSFVANLFLATMSTKGLSVYRKTIVNVTVKGRCQGIVESLIGSFINRIIHKTAPTKKELFTIQNWWLCPESVLILLTKPFQNKK